MGRRRSTIADAIFAQRSSEDSDRICFQYDIWQSDNDDNECSGADTGADSGAMVTRSRSCGFQSSLLDALSGEPTRRTKTSIRRGS